MPSSRSQQKPPATERRERKHATAASEELVGADVRGAARAEHNEDVRGQAEERERIAEAFGWEVAAPECRTAWSERADCDLRRQTQRAHQVRWVRTLLREHTTVHGQEAPSTHSYRTSKTKNALRIHAYERVSVGTSSARPAALPNRHARSSSWTRPLSWSKSLPPIARQSMKLEKTRPLGRIPDGTTASSVGYHRKTGVTAKTYC